MQLIVLAFRRQPRDGDVRGYGGTYAALASTTAFGPTAVLAPVTREAGGKPIRFEIHAGSENDALEFMYRVANKMACDIHGAEWPADIRSLSKGDVLSIERSDGVRSVAVSSIGFADADLTGVRQVPIEGTEATSRWAV